MRFDSIFLDLDGTLWEFSDVCILGWKAVMDELNLPQPRPTADDIRGVSGMQPEQICDRLLTGIPMEQAIPIFEQCLIRCGDFLDRYAECLYPGAVETVRQLSRDYRLFIVSNCTETYLKNCLKTTGMGEYLTEAAHFGAAGDGKTDSIRNLLAKHGLRSPIYVGDTRMDKVDSEAAGAVFVHASYGFGAVPEARYAISSIRELPECVARMEQEA